MKTAASKRKLPPRRRAAPGRSGSTAPADAGRRAAAIVHGLRGTQPDAGCTLDHTSALDLLVATILSAQCTDERVNILTKNLFRKYRSAADYAAAPLAELEEDVRPSGFYRNKAKSIVAASCTLVERHRGEVPDRMEELVALAGVGRKTANVILGTWFGRPAITVDTHVKRLSNRMGLTRHSDPDKIEIDLVAAVAETDRTFFSHALILHGRTVCQARRPACDRCFYQADCPFPGTAEGRALLAKRLGR